MTLSIDAIAGYLGKDSSVILSSNPFINWECEKTRESDLEAVQFDYVFPNDGVDFVSDEEDKVSSIFLYSDESRIFSEGVEDLKMTSSRKEVRVLFGVPSNSGDGLSDPLLGEFGAWDRFSQEGFAIHIEYRLNSDVISKVTLMRDDVVPT